MSKIKLVVSDLHLGSGRFLKNGRSNSLEEFFYDDQFSEFLKYYTENDYKDYEVELVLNGDIFNAIQEEYKNHHLTVITEAVSLQKIKTIVEGHAKFFKALKNFCALEGNTITYVVGNHDQDILWPGVQRYLNSILDTSILFKSLVYYVDGLHIEHGHMHESANRLNPKRFFLKKGLVEPVLNLPLGSHFFIEVVLKIKEKYPHIDKVRPFGQMMRWLFFNKTFVGFYSVYLGFFYFAKHLFKPQAHKGWSFKHVLRVILESAIYPDLTEAAGKILQDQRVHTVIFGHTHVYQYHQFPSGKEYFNTGTWTEVTSLDAPSLGRMTKLIYVLVAYPDGENEEQTKPYGLLKEWKGHYRVEADMVG